MGAAEAIKSAVKKCGSLNLFLTWLYVNTYQPVKARAMAREKGLAVNFDKALINVSGQGKTVRIARRHAIYLGDVIKNFDYYAEAVEADASGVIDYSKPNLHQVKGFDLHPIRFPSLAEPVATTEQYLDFADLSAGSVVLDLGAYSALTSIMFRELCGDEGKVIAVDADADNILAIRENIDSYRGKTGRDIDLLEGAVWTHSDGISFSSEGNMGSSAVDIVGNRIGATSLVPSFTLSNIADRFGLKRIDFIKCDIEGGEGRIFQDNAFFQRFHPRMIVEVHPVGGSLTTDRVKQALSPHGYQFRMVDQVGDAFPLLECWAA
jgi:FkbM family methyltransferase